MTTYLLKRLFSSLLILIVVTIIVFMLSRLSGDPVQLMLSDLATPEQVAALRAQLGLDQPYPIQYLRFLGDLARGDLGRSIQFNVPVVEVIPERLYYSLLLTGTAFTFALLVSIPLGLAGAVWRNQGIDYVTGLISSVLQGMPVFWLGLLLILFFSVRLGWFPTSGWNGPESLVLPGLTLGALPLARMSRLLRSSLLEVLDQDYIRTARGKGLHEATVLLRHALRNAAVPVITLMGLQIGVLIGGAVITESVFAWPGIGKLILDAVLARDYPLVQACVLLLAVLIIGINLATDVIYTLIDPRITFSSGG